MKWCGRTVLLEIVERLDGNGEAPIRRLGKADG